MNCAQFKMIPCEELLISIGHQPQKQNEREVWFLNPFGKESESSFKVNRIKNIWYLYSEGIGGNNIDFMKKYFSYSVSEILNWATNKKFSKYHPPEIITYSNYKINSIKPIENKNLKKYLFGRGLSDRTYQYVKEINFTVDSKTLYALGQQNISGGWELRNAFYKGSIFKKDITIINNDSKKVFVVEGFIEALSLIELSRNFTDDILILNSVTLISTAVQHLQKYNEHILLLNNDKSGLKGTDSLLQFFPHAKNKSSKILPYIDLNDYLVSIKKIKTI